MPKQNISPSTKVFPHNERHEIIDGKIFARKSRRKIEDLCSRFCSHKNRPYYVRIQPINELNNILVVCGYQGAITVSTCPSCLYFHKYDINKPPGKTAEIARCVLERHTMIADRSVTTALAAKYRELGNINMSKDAPGQANISIYSVWMRSGYKSFET